MENSLMKTLVAAIVVPVAFAVACGSAENALTSTSGNTGSGGAGNLNGSGGLDIASTGNGGSGGGLDENTACAKQEAVATLKTAPVDIIIVVDNSGSMTESIGGIQKNINDSFAKIIDASGIDYRVILLARHGKSSSSQSVCIEAPLSGIPVGGCAAPPAMPVNNPPKFYHYSQEVSSHDALCQVLRTYTAADEHKLAPNGWKAWLRPDAFKLVVVVTDDNANCTVNGKTYSEGGTNPIKATALAAQFDLDLLALDPAQFGTAMKRNYRLYSIVAIADKDPKNPATPWPPSDPLNVLKCGNNPSPGLGYQALSILTEGLRFPICSLNNYDSIFKELAKGVISGAGLSCNFPIPAAPAGELINPDSIVVTFTPGDGSGTQNFSQVASEAECAAGKFYLSADEIQLCKDTCDTVGMDKDGKIKILFGCIGVSN